jgi:large subunit ribosomal protein L14
MIQHRTILNVADNTGVKKLQCIGIPGYSKKRYAEIGEVIVCTVKEALPTSEIKKGTVVRAVIVRQKKPWRRKDGSYVRFFENAAVILDKEKDIKGTRIFGPIPREFKDWGYDRIVSLAQALV